MGKGARLNIKYLLPDIRKKKKRLKCLLCKKILCKSDDEKKSQICCKCKIILTKDKNLIEQLIKLKTPTN